MCLLIVLRSYIKPTEFGESNARDNWFCLDRLCQRNFHFYFVLSAQLTKHGQRQLEVDTILFHVLCSITLVVDFWNKGTTDQSDV